jgi:uncharacterized protein Smg (DUF494 family)
LRLLADRLEAHLEGDELALETLSEAIDDSPFTADDLQSAVLVLRSFANDSGWSEAPFESEPGENVQRVLSREEREALSTEAWGILLGLRRRGSLSAEQFEQVLEMLGGCGVRPVGVDLALEVATRVALQDGASEGTEIPHGEQDLAN